MSGLAAAAVEGPGEAKSTPGWAEDALGFLLSPVDRRAFLDDYFEKKPLISLSGRPGRFDDLLSLDALDRFLASADLREGMIELANHRNRVDPDSYILSDGRISGVAVAEEYARGSTIIFPHLHDSLFHLGEFCRALEEVLTCHVQTNIYLTPSGNQGFPPHYDNHDVIVMQISGAKAWRLYETHVDTPFRGEGFELGRHQPGNVAEAFTLNPGDCLYLPRGIMHDAENVGDEPSLHITVGLITKTWADLMLEAVSELALSEPAFRLSLPPGYAHRDFDREIARKQFEKLAKLIGDQASMDGAFDLMADNFLRGRRANLAGVLAAAPAVPRAGESYRRRPRVPWTAADDDGRIALIGPGGDLDFDAADGDALDVALSGRPFTLADLPCTDPQALIRRLWTHGYLERIGA